jgi:hypothetical protein
MYGCQGAVPSDRRGSPRRGARAAPRAVRARRGREEAAPVGGDADRPRECHCYRLDRGCRTRVAQHAVNEEGAGALAGRPSAAESLPTAETWRSPDRWPARRGCERQVSRPADADADSCLVPVWRRTAAATGRVPRISTRPPPSWTRATNAWTSAAPAASHRSTRLRSSVTRARGRSSAAANAPSTARTVPATSGCLQRAAVA